MTSTSATTAARGDRAELEREIESHRRELTGYCYRMLGSSFEAEDAVQEVMVRAWRSLDSWEGRSSLRSWLYRIAHNACIDMLRGPQRRARPVDLGPPGRADADLAPPTPESEWITPMRDERILPPEGDPADLAATRDSIRLAFVAALQHLPPRQRAVLILREVLRWQATEVAELLDTSVASVNSALQRARATLAEADVDAAPALDEDHEALLASYVDAFERYDVTALVGLLHDDVRFSMPPFPLWIQGPDEVATFLEGHGIGCKGSRTIVTTPANGCPVVAAYKPDPDGGFTPWALHLLEVSDGRIASWTNFIGAEHFEAFGLPPRLG